MKYKLHLIIILALLIILPKKTSALTPGTLLYRTSSDGKMFGYSGDPLIVADENKIVRHIYSGHVGIYVGKENGEDYIVEALAGGIVKTPAKYFVNEAQGEKLIGAKIPSEATPFQIAKAVKIAKNLVGQKLSYDFDFKNQKGPGDGDWTCVGLAEKIYESAGISNPNNLNSLEYDSNYYAIDITPDGFDNRSFENDEGDCFSRTVEYSKIERKKEIRFPFPEVVGFNAGVIHKGERYIFMPYTQYLQPSLRSEKVDIDLETYFIDDTIRGKTPIAKIMLKWSLINNPISSLRSVAQKTISKISGLRDKVFGNSEVVIDEEMNEDQLSLIENIESLTDNHLPVIKINENMEVNSQESKIKSNSTSKNKEKLEKEIEQNQIPSINIVATESSGEIEKETNANKIATSEDKELKPIIKTDYSQISSSLKASLIKPEPQSSLVINTSTSPKKDSNTSLSSKIKSGIKPAQASTSPQTHSSTGPQTALINKVYSTENNDFIELFNPNDYDIDLAEAGFRLEKAKTAVDPSLMMRIGNLSDGLYPGGTIIQARGYYLIVRDDANQHYKNMADAIAIRNEFSWTESGYIIYLGKGAISSTSDEDTIDAVGFGEASYYRGSGPAPTITDNYVLNRIKSTGDNENDFNLIVSDDPGIVWEGEDEINNSNDDNDNNEEEEENDNNEDDENEESPNPEIFVSPTPIISSGIIDLWHFSECYGDQKYTVGRFDCGIDIGFTNTAFTKNLSETVNLNNFSISYYYRKGRMPNEQSQINLTFRNPVGQEVGVMLDDSLLQIDGLPNSAWRYYGEPVYPDEDWHQFTMVVNKEAGYWAAYIDGVEIVKENFYQTVATNYSQVEFTGYAGPASIDEIAIWNRALSSSEILDYYQKAAPFSPNEERPNQKEAVLKYFWNFNEGHEKINEGGGVEAGDELHNVKMNLPQNSWIWRSSENTGIVNKWGNDLVVDLPNTIYSKDLSLAFWWRSELPSLDGRSLVSLQHNNEVVMGMAPDLYRKNFLFNNIYGIFSEGNDVDIPFDNKWHHLALTYDSYRYKLKFYVDGKEKRSIPYYWIKDGREPNRLKIKSELNSVELDDLGIWEGTLTNNEVEKVYLETKISN